MWRGTASTAHCHSQAGYTPTTPKLSCRCELTRDPQAGLQQVAMAAGVGRTSGLGSRARRRRRRLPCLGSRARRRRRRLPRLGSRARRRRWRLPRRGSRARRRRWHLPRRGRLPANSSPGGPVGSWLAARHAKRDKPCDPAIGSAAAFLSPVGVGGGVKIAGLALPAVQAFEGASAAINMVLVKAAVLGSWQLLAMHAQWGGTSAQAQATKQARQPKRSAMQNATPRAALLTPRPRAPCSSCRRCTQGCLSRPRSSRLQTPA